MNTTTLTGIGIDVSKAELVVALRDTAQTKILRVPNKQNEIQKLVKQLVGYNYKIVLESTGRFHLLAALTFAEAGFDVRVINPLLAYKYARASVRKIKSDPADAESLAEMAEREQNLPAKFQLNRNAITLKTKLNLLHSLEKQIQQLTAIKNSFVATRTELSLAKSAAETNLAKSLQVLQKTRDQLLRELEEPAVDSSNSGQHLTEIPGVSNLVAALFVHFFDISANSSRQWVAFAGLDVSTRQSGAWHGKSRLTKRGNAYLRKRLFGAAWGAMLHDARVKNFYNKLRALGRSYREALIIIARKILTVAFAILKRGESYNPSLVFAS